jgi:hypothetical protein
MAVERDNDSEREERIRRILARLKAVQAEVARLAAEGSERAAQMAAKGKAATPALKPEPTDPE